MYLANVRYADLLRGDLMAQFGSVWTAERRLHQLCEEFGGALVVRYADEIIDYTNRRARAAIREIPNGIYIGESWMDSDAKEQQNLLVRATVTVEDETIHVDFAGTAPQVPSGHNASLGVCVAQATAAIAMMFDADIPRNEGCFDLITVTAPEGSMVNPIWPASTASATTQPGDVIARQSPRRSRRSFHRGSALGPLTGPTCRTCLARTPTPEWRGVTSCSTAAVVAEPPTERTGGRCGCAWQRRADSRSGHRTQ